MFLHLPTTRRWASRRDGTQHASGMFLILLQRLDQDLGPGNCRGLVRSVTMSQCGHFMMGSITIKGVKIILSGSYGNDGLIRSLPGTMLSYDDPRYDPDKKPFVHNPDELHVWELATPLPQDLYDAWAKGDGWNSAGKEAPLMQDWALSIMSGQALAIQADKMMRHRFVRYTNRQDRIKKIKEWQDSHKL